jgi:hypothetical protein
MARVVLFGFGPSAFNFKVGGTKHKLKTIIEFNFFVLIWVWSISSMKGWTILNIRRARAVRGEKKHLILNRG